MASEVTLSYKIAAGAVVLAFALSIGLFLVYLGRASWNNLTVPVENATASMVDTDAYFLASYNKPVPVAAVWKLTQRVNMNAKNMAVNANGNFSSFQIYAQNAGTYQLVSSSVSDLGTYMAKKAYVSWSLDQKTGLYSAEVYLA